MSLYESASKFVNTGSDLFVNVSSGQKVRLRILDHPYVSLKQWKEGGELKARFHWPVWDYEADKVKVLEQGPMVFNLIADVVAEYGEDVPMDCDIVLGRTGEGMSTRYSVVASRIRSDLPKNYELPDLASTVKGGIPLSEFSKGKKPVVQSKDADYEPEDVPLDAYDDLA